jgi:hypothetical protein
LAILFLLPNQKNNLRAERPKGRSALILISKIANHKKKNGGAQY